ncbi:hypothetical protein [Cellulomonas chengniuliangii]|uniref:Alkaline shock response membrane anchor protein AmaP n=1 Tax=Cellulomonas chengniuliangii TaxID=2968084 RepID=A0ABY5KVY3_9CELL|nr:hypothetical protein [Cellulomonas chengniuliangii]MCC2310003.1 hypothetical protein [Cellulomonas chengniuliangii]MCC2317013.1 hypothetical protein [Cellulomonas chengniuliangii]UUI74599.1 hypothetical protein NP064_12450 [Cellulomonas chengniuliangii]
MSRGVIGWDRVAAFLLGLVLLAGGLAVVAWWAGYLDDLWSAAPDALDTSAAADLAEQAWWPWALGALGVALVVFGLWWLLAHIPRRSTGPLRLRGSGSAGALTIDGGRATQAAADAVAGTPGVRAASGSLSRDRGELVAGLRITIDPTADLEEVASAVEAASADLHQVLGRDDVRCRAQVLVAPNARPGSKVS